jgi:glycerol-3-phosphate acyltransferase PlsY
MILAEEFTVRLWFTLPKLGAPEPMVTNRWLMFLAIPLAAYAIGAIPFGLLIARAKGVDLRASGSGNIGATNVGRTLGKPWGILCFLLDFAKGAGPAMAAGWLIGAMGRDGAPTHAQQLSWLLVGAACVLGHVFPIWLGFRGGKGVATGLGTVMGMYPYFTLAGAAAFVVWVVVTMLSRYVSLGSIVGCICFLLFFAAQYARMLGELWPMGLFSAVMVGLIIYRHRKNILRLLDGTENRIGTKTAPADETPDTDDAPDEASNATT